jgi:hypothetical protein
MLRKKVNHNAAALKALCAMNHCQCSTTVEEKQVYRAFGRVRSGAKGLQRLSLKNRLSRSGKVRFLIGPNYDHSRRSLPATSTAAASASAMADWISASGQVTCSTCLSTAGVMKRL